jgi:hypothetical protein
MHILSVAHGPITVLAAHTVALKLLPDQVQRRRHKLAEIDATANLWRFKDAGDSTQFKEGEIFGFDGDPKRAFPGLRIGVELVVTSLEPRPVLLPQDWRALKFAELQPIAARFAADPVRSKDQAIDEIAAALAAGLAAETELKAE